MLVGFGIIVLKALAQDMLPSPCYVCVISVLSFVHSSPVECCRQRLLWDVLFFQHYPQTFKTDSCSILIQDVSFLANTVNYHSGGWWCSCVVCVGFPPCPLLLFMCSLGLMIFGSAWPSPVLAEIGLVIIVAQISEADLEGARFIPSPQVLFAPKSAGRLATP